MHKGTHCLGVVLHIRGYLISHDTMAHLLLYQSLHGAIPIMKTNEPLTPTTDANFDFINEHDLDAALLDVELRDKSRSSRAELGSQLKEGHEQIVANYLANNPDAKLIIRGGYAVLPATPPEYFENLVDLVRSFFVTPELLNSTNECLANHLSNKLPSYPTNVAALTHKVSGSLLGRMFEVLIQNGVNHLSQAQHNSISKIKRALRALGKPQYIDPCKKSAVVFNRTHVFVNGQGWKITEQKGRGTNKTTEVIRVIVNGLERRVPVDALRQLFDY